MTHVIKEENYLAHYGILRKSGRYPWGSGDTQPARNQSFLDYVADMKNKGLSDVEISRGVGMTTTQLRAAKSIAKNEQKIAQIARVQQLKDRGLSNSAIGRKMGINESSVRSLHAAAQKDQKDNLTTIANMLQEQVEKKGVIDVGAGNENHLGITDTKLKTAVAVLEERGYKKHQVKVMQPGTGKLTTFKVIARKDIEWKQIVNDPTMIKTVMDIRSKDGGRSFLGILPPMNISSKRIGIRYKEDGGDQADGVIYVRPGVLDVSLGKARYAQVRIAVDGTHYLKGMAMYKDDLPPGVDLVFNTNKSSTGNKLDAMKAMKDDPDNPFGSMVDQITEKDKHGNEKVISVMNKVNEEGQWDDWSRNLSSQMLSKQSPPLAKNQLKITYENKKADFDEIKSLTNPAVKKRLLLSYADDADSSAVHLKAAGMPRQRTQVILPVNSLKPNEIYAPNFRNGERVVLVRYPHGGKFEIPELVVNNNNREAKRSLAGAEKIDAVGIHHKVAERLSGADFDGDTVLVIPNNGNRVKTEPALARLKNFDPIRDYKLPDEAPKMTAKTKGTQMGLVSNLITDMTIRGANNDELARAVRHSMVVIDAEKHHLNYKQSAIDHGIPDLVKKYQPDAKSSQGGASTLISQAKGRKDVPERKQGYSIDPVSGRKIYRETGASYTDSKGKLVVKTQRSQKLAETDDAHDLSSGTPIEKVYADHSNRLKDLANQARLEALRTKPIAVSPSAKKVYANEVKSLNAKLDIAFRNRPLERQAIILADYTWKAKRNANPDMDAAEEKKIKGAALQEARIRTGAKKQLIVPTPREWEAIQAGAISNTKLDQILNNADLDSIKQLATPKSKLKMTSLKEQQARILLNSGYTQAEVADQLGVSLTTLKSSL